MADLKKEIAELQDALQKSRLERTTDTQQHSTNSQGLDDYSNKQCLTPTSTNLHRVKSTQFVTTNQFSNSAITYQKASINGNTPPHLTSLDLIGTANQTVKPNTNKIYNYDSRINYGPGHFRPLNQ